MAVENPDTQELIESQQKRVTNSRKRLAEERKAKLIRERGDSAVSDTLERLRKMNTVGPLRPLVGNETLDDSRSAEAHAIDNETKAEEGQK